ncbi:MAG: hypothetical protein S4CHLAM6_13960 [Chlamydiae bacterium]|nr:hypothetical protein [Chlamydiota bacterium]
MAIRILPKKVESLQCPEAIGEIIEMSSLPINQFSSMVSSATYSDCSNILSQNVLISYANYYFSIVSDFSYTEYLKEVVCKILFATREYSEKDLVNKLIGKGTGLIEKISSYSDQAQLGGISLIKILASISNRMKHITLIGEAARYGMVEVVAKLLQNNANPDVGSCPPFHRAAMGASRVKGIEVLKQQKIARLLLKHGAQVDSTDLQGNTPLHFSTYSPSFSKILVDEGGASLSIWNGDGSTPLDNAQFSSWVYPSAQKTSEFLSEKGAENGFFRTLAKDTSVVVFCANYFSFTSKWTKGAFLKQSYTVISYKINNLFYDASGGCMDLR